jgi:hypothetical protein
MLRAVAVTVGTVALLAMMYVGFQRMAVHGVPPLQSRTFRLQIEDGRLVSRPAVLEAFQGDVITLRVTSNRPAVFHVHEYEQHVVLDLRPGEEHVATFKADAAGRFGVHLVGEGASFAEIAAMQVQPR